MSLAIIILNYRTPGMTRDCLESLLPCLDEVPGARVLLVDNASGDDSVKQLRQVISSPEFGGRVRLIESDRNLGFAGGNNFGLTYLEATDRFVLLLNSDTLLHSGTLRHCVKYMQQEEDVGILSCRLENRDGSLQENCRRMPTPLRMTVHTLGLEYRFPRLFEWADLEGRSWDRHGAMDVDWVGGAFMLIRREVLDGIGPLDSSFFFYGEDAEFCHRARVAGWRVRYDGRVGIVHMGGGSSDPARLERRSRDRLTWAARYLLQRRCFGRLSEWYLRGLDVLTYAARTLRLRLSPRRRQDYLTHRQILSVLLTAPGVDRGMKLGGGIGGT